MIKVVVRKELRKGLKIFQEYEFIHESKIKIKGTQLNKELQL